MIWNVIITPETMQQSSHHCQHRHYRHQPSIFSDKNPWPSLSHQYQCRAECSLVNIFSLTFPAPNIAGLQSTCCTGDGRGVCAAGRGSTSPSLGSVCPCPDQHLDNYRGAIVQPTEHSDVDTFCSDIMCHWFHSISYIVLTDNRMLLELCIILIY